jgi:hypothetical protein
MLNDRMLLLIFSNNFSENYSKINKQNLCDCQSPFQANLSTFNKSHSLASQLNWEDIFTK